MVNRAELRLAPQDKIVCHPQFADYLAGQKIYPVGVEISPSGVCNASCDFCCVAGTLIETPQGYRAIEDINPGDSLYTPDGLVGLVKESFHRWASDLVRVCCTGREIHVTFEHPFLTHRGWVRAIDLTRDDYLVIRVRDRPSPPLFSAFIYHRNLTLFGLSLERGLELRPLEKVCRLNVKQPVYNLSCEPVEAYEANGFVVHNCFYANTGELGGHRKVFLDLSRTMALLDECATLAIKAITWTGGGDPSLHPNIGQFVGRTRDLGMDQGMFTNALAHPTYDPALLSWVRVTMTDKPYKPQYIKILRKCPVLGFAFNYAGPQDDEYLWETLHLAEDVQADYVQLRPALAFHGQTVDIQPPAIQHPLLHVTAYKFADAKVPHGYKACEGFHFVPFIWEDGDVDICAYMRKWEGYNLGNIYKNRLKSILDDAPQSVAVTHECQVCCKLNDINKRIHASRQLEDVNFP